MQWLMLGDDLTKCGLPMHLEAKLSTQVRVRVRVRVLGP